MSSVPGWAEPEMTRVPAALKASGVSTGVGAIEGGRSHLSMSGVGSPGDSASTSPSLIERRVCSERMVGLLRLANIAAIALLLTCAILNFLVPSLDVASALLSVYAIIFSIVLCCFLLPPTVQPNFVSSTIASNCGFLLNELLKFLFYVLLGSLTWIMGVLGKVTSAVLWGVAVGNFVLAKCNVKLPSANDTA